MTTRWRRCCWPISPSCCRSASSRRRRSRRCRRSAAWWRPARCWRCCCRLPTPHRARVRADRGGRAEALWENRGPLAAASTPLHQAPLQRWSAPPALTASLGLHAVAAGAAVLMPDAIWWALGAIALNHVGLTAAGLWPRSRLLGPNWTRLPAAAAARAQFALTIDDGPDPQVTPRVLDLLEQHGARATFFCIAERAL